MAKTESTAVNDLIQIAATQKPPLVDPSEDLMFAIPSKKDRNPKLSARGTAQVAPLPLPLPRDRAPHSTEEHAIAMPAIKIATSRSSAIPPLSPASTRTTALPPGSALAAPAPISTRAPRPSLPPPIRQPLLSPMRPALPSEYPIVSAVHSLPLAPAPVARARTATPWADVDVDVDADVDVSMPFSGESTAQVAKPRTNLEWIVKLAPWMGAMVVLGVLIGGFIVFDGQGGKQRAATPPVEVVADSDPVGLAVASTTDEMAPTTTSPTMIPVTASITTPVPTTTAIAKRPVFIDVRIDSKPAGATVILVDRGKQTFLGTTPISAAVDPTRAYDVVFAYPNRQTQIEHFEPKATARLSVVLGKPGNRATPELTPPATARRLGTTTATTPTEVAPARGAKSAKAAKAARIVEPTWEEPAAVETITAVAKTEAPVKATRPEAPAMKTEAAPTTNAKAEKAVGGDGFLMISSKPPCEIHVDGKPTGLMTPQRALPLTAGKHRITLVHPTEKIRKSFPVEITANASTKVIQDLMK